MKPRKSLNRLLRMRLEAADQKVKSAVVDAASDARRDALSALFAKLKHEKNVAF